MINYLVYKKYFPNSDLKNQHIEKKHSNKFNHYSLVNLDTVRPKIVDINKLLNRVKIEKKKETNRNYKFFCLIVLGLSLAGFSILILKNILI